MSDFRSTFVYETHELRQMRSEFSANISLIPTTKNPSWKDPAPIRTHRRTYGILSIAQRHPRLFSWLSRKG